MPLLERIVSSPLNVFVGATREAAYEAALDGIGTAAVAVPRVLAWPTLQRYENDNAPFETYNPAAQNPDYVWSSVTETPQTIGLAVSSTVHEFTQSTIFDLSLVVFADNAHQTQIDLINDDTGEPVPTRFTGVPLNDGSLDPTTGVTTEQLYFPYNWQNIRFYSITTGFVPAGNYRIIVSFTAVNYDQFGELSNPAAIAFAVDIFAPSTEGGVFNQSTNTFSRTIDEAVANAAPNDTLLVLPGVTVQSTVVDINKTLTLRGSLGSTILATSPVTAPFRLTGDNIVFRNMRMTTDVQRDNWEFVQVGGNNNQVVENEIFGPELPPPNSNWPDTRGIATAPNNANNALIQGNNILSLRTGMRLNPNTNGRVLDNAVNNTRGGVVVQASIFEISGNSWEAGSNTFDIVLLPGTIEGQPYDPLSALSEANNNASISDQRGQQQEEF